jgi:phosphomannomutase
VKNRNKFIFDVDGTLTPSRGKMDYNFKAFFNTFCLVNDVYLVTGSDKPKTVEQISEGTYNLCKRVYQCSGSDVWDAETNILKSGWTLPDLARTFLISCEYESPFSLRTGNHIEQRTGMVNFSVVGRNANVEQRAKYVEYDTVKNERTTIASAFNTMFPDLQATVGGDTGIDIAPRGADKSQILRDFKEDDTIHFYGDAMFEGGNDKPLADALQKYQLGFSHQVRDWDHTWEKLREYSTNRS